MIDDSVNEYLDSLPQERKDFVMMLHQMVLDQYPDCDVDMQYKMPTYHQGEGWVALANQKNYVSLYTCGEHHLEKFKQAHPKVKTGKGCINFNPAQALPMVDVIDVIRHAIEHPKE